MDNIVTEMDLAHMKRVSELERRVNIIQKAQKFKKYRNIHKRQCKLKVTEEK